MPGRFGPHGGRLGGGLTPLSEIFMLSAFIIYHFNVMKFPAVRN
jgi:hypothetical protein